MNKLIILDLDETLIHTESFPNEYEDDLSFDFKIPSDNPNYTYFTKKRPYLDQFIKYCFDNFNVAIWTASGEEYAEIVLSNIGINKDKLEFLYSSDNCTMKMNYQTGDHCVVKNLNKIKSKYDLKNVLIIDDTMTTASNNYGNLIHIKSFLYDVNDTELLKLISYLERIKSSSNFRSIEKRGWSV